MNECMNEQESPLAWLCLFGGGRPYRSDHKGSASVENGRNTDREVLHRLQHQPLHHKVLSLILGNTYARVQFWLSQDFFSFHVHEESLIKKQSREKKQQELGESTWGELGSGSFDFLARGLLTRLCGCGLLKPQTGSWRNSLSDKA